MPCSNNLVRMKHDFQTILGEFPPGQIPPGELNPGQSPLGEFLTLTLIHQAGINRGKLNSPGGILRTPLSRQRFRHDLQIERAQFLS